MERPPSKVTPGLPAIGSDPPSQATPPAVQPEGRYGRYNLLERIGVGGMAEVFKAKSYGVEGFEKVVVIKRIIPELAESQNFTRDLVNEPGNILTPTLLAQKAKAMATEQGLACEILSLFLISASQ